MFLLCYTFVARKDENDIEYQGSGRECPPVCAKGLISVVFFLMKKNETEGSTLILGVGNEILTDDGIGPKLVNDIDRERLPSGIDYLNTSLGGLEMLDLMCKYENVVLIDAMKTGILPPGSVHYYTPDDFRETLHLSNFHDINFLTALELGRRTGMSVPANIHIIAIEIIEDMVFDTQFSPEICERYPAILNKVEDLLQYLVRNSLDDYSL